MTADRGDAAKVPLPLSTAQAHPTPGARPEDSRASPDTAAAAKEESAAQAADPPLPDEEAPPLPDEAPPRADDDGWEYRWDDDARAWFFFNTRTGLSQWENPRMPAADAYASGSNDRPTTGAAGALPSSAGAPGTSSPPAPRRKWGGYNPAIHGSYDPNADYAKEAAKEEEEAEQAAAAAAAASNPFANNQGYSTTAQFNRYTGKFQQPGMGPEMHNDENKSRRQMNAFFDVDAAANSHDGRSLKEERRNQTLTKKEVKAYKNKRREKKEEKRRAWLRD